MDGGGSHLFLEWRCGDHEGGTYWQSWVWDPEKHEKSEGEVQAKGHGVDLSPIAPPQNHSDSDYTVISSLGPDLHQAVGAQAVAGLTQSFLTGLAFPFLFSPLLLLIFFFFFFLKPLLPFRKYGFRIGH